MTFRNKVKEIIKQTEKAASDRVKAKDFTGRFGVYFGLTERIKGVFDEHPELTNASQFCTDVDSLITISRRFLDFKPVLIIESFRHLQAEPCTGLRDLCKIFWSLSDAGITIYELASGTIKTPIEQSDDLQIDILCMVAAENHQIPAPVLIPDLTPKLHTTAQEVAELQSEINALVERVLKERLSADELAYLDKLSDAHMLRKMALEISAKK